MPQAVDGRRIDPVDALVQRRMNGVHRLVVVLRAPGELPSSAAHGPRAHADRRDFQIARTQSSLLHFSILPALRSQSRARRVAFSLRWPAHRCDDAANRCGKGLNVGRLLDKFPRSQFQYPGPLGVVQRGAKDDHRDVLRFPALQQRRSR